MSRPHTWLGGGHTCLYEGQVFDSLAEGAAYAESAGSERGDVDAARAVVGTATDAELFLCPGDRHPFTDSSLPSYDEQPATQVNHRVLGFLDRMR
ncbi:hypothetical protein [Streptomyces sp. NPDC017988]|uniref:hypothetical protein n=1 Tax=Streptomyces sp. NPDC017988 TaxID=3365025 RepID=UPI0037A278CE